MTYIIGTITAGTEWKVYSKNDKLLNYNKNLQKCKIYIYIILYIFRQYKLQFETYVLHTIQTRAG